MKEKLSESERLTHYYRWKFLRLNREFQIASDICTNDANKIKKHRRWSTQTKQRRIAELEDGLFKKYGINGIYDHRRKTPPKELRIYGEEDYPVQKAEFFSEFDLKPVA